MSTSRLKQLIFAALLYTFTQSCAIHAQEAESDLFSAELLIESVYDDNVERTEDDDLRNGEVQHRGSIQVEGEYGTGLNYFNIHYRALTERFTEDSQPNQTVYLGNAHYHLGNDRSVYDLSLAQRDELVLRSPTDELLTSNTRSQRTTTITPGLKTRRDTANRFIVRGIYSQVTSDEGEDTNGVPIESTLSDAEQHALRLTWNRDISRLYDFGIHAVTSRTEFADSPEVDYESNKISAYIEAELRKIEYSFSIGAQRIRNFTFDRPYTGAVYSININYNDAGNELIYQESLTISDTSFTNFVSDTRSGIAVGSSGESQDNIEQFVRRLAWRTTNVCTSCSFDVNLSSQDLVYFSQPWNNSRNMSVEIAFQYNLSYYSRLGVALTGRVTQELAIRESDDVLNQAVNMNYQRRLSRRISGLIYINHFTREEGIAYHDVNTLGLRLVMEL